MEVGIIIFIIGIIFSYFKDKMDNNSNNSNQPNKKTAQKTQIKSLEELKHEFEQRAQQVEKAVPVKEAPSPQKVVKSPAATRSSGDRKTRQQTTLDGQMTAIMKDQHLSEKQKVQRINQLTEGDLTVEHEPLLDFSKHNLVQSLIMSEVLAPPKSKR